METPQEAPPTVSHDGRFFHDGQRWVPFPRSGPSGRAVARGLVEETARFLVELTVVLVVVPLVMVVAVLAAVSVAPEGLDLPVAVAVVVLLCAAVWPFTRSRRR